MDFNHFEFLTLTFIFSNIASELIKYVAVKAITKLDDKIDDPLD